MSISCVPFEAARRARIVLLFVHKGGDGDDDDGLSL